MFLTNTNTMTYKEKYERAACNIFKDIKYLLRYHYVYGFHLKLKPSLPTSPHLLPLLFIFSPLLPLLLNSDYYVIAIRSGSFDHLKMKPSLLSSHFSLLPLTFRSPHVPNSPNFYPLLPNSPHL